MITAILPNGIEIFLDHTGAYRKLAHRPRPKEMLKQYTPYRAALPLVEQAKWVPINRRKQFDWTLDQNGHGSCTDHALTGNQRKTRVMQGMTDVELSATWGYSWANGGRDDGAMTSELLTVCQQHGKCLMSQFPEKYIYQSQISKAAQQECLATAARFKVTDAWMIGEDGARSFNEIMSGLQLGFIVSLSIMVGNNFDNFDADGCCGWAAGLGNHAIHVDGCKQLASGEWVLDMHNSWGAGWGQNGRAYLRAKHCNTVQQDGYALRVALDDPNDPANPPAVSP